MSVKDEKLDELAELLGFDTGLAQATRRAQADASVDEIQKLVDDARAVRIKISQLPPLPLP